MNYITLWKVGEVKMMDLIIVHDDDGTIHADWLIRCKDCVHRGKSEKCVLAAISEEKGFPIFMLDNRGDWYCGDGKRSETDGH